MKKMLFCLLFVTSLVQISFGQTEIDMANTFPCTGCSGYSNPNANLDSLRPVKYARLQEIFKEISKDSGIEFNYSQAACQQRTQYLSMLLTKKYKLDHFRVWLFSAPNLDRNGKELLQIKDKNGLSENGTISWAYHVAPAVKVEDKVFVIDPSLDSEKPMQLDNWLKSVGNSNKGGYSFISSEYYFFYRQYDSQNNLLKVINGQFYTYGETPKQNLTLEKGLALNDVAMTIYKNYIFPLKNSTKEADIEKLKQLKYIFGSYDNLQSFLAQDQNFKLEPGRMRNFYTNYDDITAEAGKVYLERTLFWVKKVNELLK